MNNLEFDILGYYKPRFLHLHLHTDQPINDLNVLANDLRYRQLFSTFLHEYVHFLQDISTPYGIMRSFLFIDTLKDVIHPIRNSGENEFRVPTQFNNDFNSLSNLRLQELYVGDQVSADRILYRAYALEHLPVTDKDNNLYQVAQYRVFYLDIADHREKSFVFGTTCIKEYMAHAIQSRYYPEIIHPDIPYVVAELICAQEYAVLSSDPMLVVALCDASLKAAHPAQLFFRTLERMKEMQFVPDSYTAVYNFAFDDVQLVGNMGSYHPEAFYDKVVDMILQQYDDLLRSPVFEANRRWLHHLFSSVRVLRLELPHFMLHLVDEEGNLQEDFRWITRILGTPFLTNDAQGYGYVPPEPIDPEGIMPYQLLAVAEVYNVLQGASCCSLYEFCSHREDQDITNEHCLSAPWLRAAETGSCPLAQLWISWGLAGKIPSPER